tara:strand:- start:859 stop:1182 length:324 start_codon:yes stop_codon:yes gene_type:complete
MDILKVLETFYKEYEWVIGNNDYDSLHWGDSNDAPKPTLEELEEKWNNQKSEIDNVEIQKERQSEILANWPIEKQFEAITEFHMGRPEKLENLTSYIQSVKDKLPKN